MVGKAPVKLVLLEEGWPEITKCVCCNMLNVAYARYTFYELSNVEYVGADADIS